MVGFGEWVRFILVGPSREYRRRGGSTRSVAGVHPPYGFPFKRIPGIGFVLFFALVCAALGWWPGRGRRENGFVPFRNGVSRWDSKEPVCRFVVSVHLLRECEFR